MNRTKQAFRQAVYAALTSPQLAYQINDGAMQTLPTANVVPRAAWLAGVNGAPPPMPLLAFSVRTTGNGSRQLPERQMQLKVWCASANGPDECEELYEAARARLHTADQDHSGALCLVPATTFLNPADRSGHVALDASNLTATWDSFGGWSGARAVGSVNAGKWYWEVVIDALGTEVVIGVATAAESLSTWVGSDVNGWGYGSSGQKYHNGPSAYGVTYAGGDVVGVALDLDAGDLTFYKNGVALGQAFTGIAGTLFPMVTGSNQSRLTARFDATSFAYAVPSGFSALPNAFVYEPIRDLSRAATDSTLPVTVRECVEERASDPDYEDKTQRWYIVAEYRVVAV